MKKRSITDSSCIESTRMMLNYGGDPIPLIQGLCATHVLTDDFIREFSQFIDEKTFSTSYKLTENMAMSHPELFKEEYFKDYFFNGKNIFEIKEAPSDSNALPDPNSSESTETTIPWESRACAVDISMAIRYCDELSNRLLTEEAAVTDFLLNMIRSCEISELTAENCITLMGFNNQVDSLLLKRVQDEEIREQILLTLSIADDSQNISSTAYKYMSNDMKERTLGTENISFREFLKVISQSKDIGWQIKMIDQVIAKEIEIIPTADSGDSEMLYAVNSMNENVFVKFTKLAKYAPNAFSYKIMNWALTNKYFNEEDLIEMKDVLKRAGCIFQLKKIAKDNNYLKLLAVI